MTRRPRHRRFDRRRPAPGHRSFQVRNRRLERMIEIEAEDDTIGDQTLLGRAGAKLGPKGRFLAAALLIGMVITVFTILEERYTAETASTADHTDEVLVAVGARVYAANCAYCHGDRLEGQPEWDGDYPSGGRPALPLDGTAPTWRLTDQGLFDVTKYGGQAFSPVTYVNDMPGFEWQLSDADIWATVAYIKSTWTEDALARQAEANRLEAGEGS